MSRVELISSERTLLKNIIDNSHFVCGAQIVPDGPAYEALSRKEVTVDRRKTCEDHLETYIYQIPKKKLENLCVAGVLMSFQMN